MTELSEQERSEVSAILETAIRDYLVKINVLDSTSDYLTDWYLVGATCNPENKRQTGYFRATAGDGDQPPHASLGLLYRAINAEMSDG